ncbi:hypothetical protein HKCCE3408_07925 [Rhodobacterales bacterium HKCCE3408]|nr:hypothetical protein [Rhodobacterales bacterium HKCCE3408]
MDYPVRLKSWSIHLNPGRHGGIRASGARIEPGGLGIMNLYRSQFAEALDIDGAPAVERTVLIASTPRCGSHMIGHAMTATGLLGRPFEYLNPANLAEWRRRLGTSGAADSLAALIARRTTPNGVFALKAHHDHCATIGGPERLLAALPNVYVVHLRRADVLRQAVSYAIARQTGVWIAGQEPVSENVEYDRDEIATCLDDIAIQNARWSSFFARAGIRPLTLIYEEVAADLPGAITQIAQYSGVIGPDETLQVAAATERQGTSGRADEWIERYAEERRGDPSLGQRIAGSARRRLQRITS